jgi:uncharacterized RDD family membrane protein YckC
LPAPAVPPPPPRTAIPRTVAPRTVAPQTVAPQPVVQQPVVPQADAPRTVIAETVVPRALVPQTVVVPEPPAPEPDLDLDLDLEPDVDAIEVHLERAPAWRRVAAWAVDLALLGLFLALLLGPVVSRSDLPLVAGLDELYEALTRRRGVLLPAATVALVAAFAYQWLGLALMGATPGKRLLRLRVVGPDGRRPSPGRSALRAALTIPSLLVLGLGPLLALFTRSGRALHDFGARTYVVRVP